MSGGGATDRRLILGTAGHIDHGKTALVRALTGVDTDRLPDEKRRGITIDLGFARLTLPDGLEFGVVDVPGHEAFVRNMVAGAAGVDVALLVVAADEGVMPQTREHLAILELLGVRRLVVALTKAELVEEAWLALVREEVSGVLEGTAHAAAPLAAVSARTGQGLDQLRAHLAAAGAAVRRRDDRDLFRLPVDRAFTVRGTGTVVTGTVWSGTVAADAALQLQPQGRAVRARGAQVHGQERREVTAGERAALALAGVDREAVRRGDTLVAPDAGWRRSSILTVRLAVLADASAPLRQRQRVRLHLGTAEVLARVRLLEGTAIQPGQAAWAQLRLETPVLARGRDRFVLRHYSPVITLGGGVVAEVDAPKRRRLPADVSDHLSALLDGQAEAAVRALVELTGPAGVPVAELAVRTGLPPGAVAGALAADAATDAVTAGVARVGERLVPAAALADAAERILAAVHGWHAARPLHPGVPVETLRPMAPDDAAPGLVDAAIGALVLGEKLHQVGPHVRRPEFVPAPTAAQREALDGLRKVYGAAALAPPGTAELAGEPGARPDLEDLLAYLEGAGELVQLRPGLLVDARALQDAVARLRGALPLDEPLAAANFKAPLGLTRKHLIPLLEYMDRIGVTRREGDRRRLLPTAPER